MVEFHDVRLRETLAHCGPIIEGYEGRLDAASSDIKALEAYLDGKVEQSVALLLSETWDYVRDCEGEVIPDRGIEGVIERLAYFRRAGRWRLMYVQSSGAGRLEFTQDWKSRDSFPVWNVETPLDRRPLIEAPAETRMRVREKLPEFVKAVARMFTIDPTEVDRATAPAAEPDYGDIPF